jgi:predicted anti-sigma-YlaC factor YlaD
MTSHPPNEYLSSYLDGELHDPEVGELEAHLRNCSECAAILTDLRRVVARAQALDDRVPSADLWPDVAAAIGMLPGRRRISLTLPQLLAAGIALMLVAGGAAWVAKGRLLSGAAPLAAAGGSGSAVEPTTPVTVVRAGSRSEQGYAQAVADLERTLANRRGRLDSTTVRIVDEKLALIDRAIAEAERALAADPGDVYLNGHLNETRLRKLQLLRRAAELTRSAT